MKETEKHRKEWEAMWYEEAWRERVFQELINLTGTQEMAEKILCYLKQLDDEENQRRRQVQKEGIRKARERGIPLGRPKKKLPKNSGFIFENFLEGIFTAEQAALYCGIGVSTLYRRVKDWERQMETAINENEKGE